MKKIISFQSGDHHIKEMQDMGISPSQEAVIIDRVLQGEDIRIVHIDKIRKNYESLQKAFSYAWIYTAAKAVSSGKMIPILKEMGSGFEVATVEELRKLIRLNVSPKDILFSHPDKDSIELSDPFTKHLKAFVSDSENDLKTLAHHIPGAKILIRIATNTNDHLCGVRFGIDKEHAKQLIKTAIQLKLQPIGLTFHVGTQSEKVEAWEKAIQTSGHIFKEMKKEGVTLDTLNLGGGFPALITKHIPSISQYSKAIKSYLNKYFKHHYPKNIIIEPGRGISGTAGLTIGRVVNVKSFHEQDSSECIVTLSVGRFNAGLLGVGQKMVFYSKNRNGIFSSTKQRKHIWGSVYGKASAPLDIVHMDSKVKIPTNLKPGDIVVFKGTGAYVDQMSSEWCGKKIPTDIIFDSQNQDQQNKTFKKSS